MRFTAARMAADYIETFGALGHRPAAKPAPASAAILTPGSDLHSFEGTAGLSQLQSS
jgi:hypothetical protein